MEERRTLGSKQTDDASDIAPDAVTVDECGWPTRWSSSHPGRRFEGESQQIRSARQAVTSRHSPNHRPPRMTRRSVRPRRSMAAWVSDRTMVDTLEVIAGALENRLTVDRWSNRRWVRDARLFRPPVGTHDRRHKIGRSWLPGRKTKGNQQRGEPSLTIAFIERTCRSPARRLHVKYLTLQAPKQQAASTPGSPNGAASGAAASWAALLPDGSCLVDVQILAYHEVPSIMSSHSVE